MIAKVDLRSNYSKEMRELLKETYGNSIRFFSEDIPKSIKVAECAVLGQSIFVHDPKGKAAEAYMSLAKEVSE